MIAGVLDWAVSHRVRLGLAHGAAVAADPDRQRRRMRRTFRQSFARRQGPLKPGERGRVLLWPDTFNNYFLPDTSKAAVGVLEAAGFRVLIPQDILCCGRPLYDFGMLDRAKRLLVRTLDALAPEIEASIPIVVLEPSCAAVFRDELINLFPDDERAQRLSRQSFLLSEFLEKKAPHFQLPNLPVKALVHGHCHHKSLMRMTDEESVLTKMGMDWSAPAPGCCGMAGSFGFDEDKYDLSMAIGELELLPAVRQAPADSFIIADGFSCREQIAQSTERQALHLAEVIGMALQGTVTPNESYPEKPQVDRRQADLERSMKRTGLGIAAIAAGAGLLWWLNRR